jgi:serine/threonine protein kinase
MVGIPPRIRSVPAPAQKPLAPRPTGAKVGKYTLQAALGQGAYGEVHLGVPSRGPRVAVKILSATAARNADTITRFKREADTARRLDHPSIIRIVDVGSSRGRHYIIMELVHGGSLRRLLERAAAPPAKLLAVLSRAASPTPAPGVVHQTSSRRTCCLRCRQGVDFGLARTVDEPRSPPRAGSSALPSTRAPEHCGQRATAASDVYAFGVSTSDHRAPFTADTQLGTPQHAEAVDKLRPDPQVLPGGGSGSRSRARQGSRRAPSGRGRRAPSPPPDPPAPAACLARDPARRGVRCTAIAPRRDPLCGDGSRRLFQRPAIRAPPTPVFPARDAENRRTRLHPAAERRQISDEAMMVRAGDYAAPTGAAEIAEST